MHETTTVVLGVLSALILWTGTIIGLVNWLNGKFRSLETNFYKELERRRNSNDHRFGQHETKIQRLELKAFGFAGPTMHGPTDEQI